MLKDTIDKLPPSLRKEAEEFVQSLLKRSTPAKTERSFKFRWGGALAELRADFNSVDLQHKVKEWR